MRAIALALGLSLWWAGIAAAFEREAEIRFGPENAARELTVLSTGDTTLFAPLIERFLERQPDVAILYTVASSAELERAVAGEGAVFDVVMSSAMDLQTKLVNDGFARPHRSAATDALPGWAKWRDQLFAFTEEPAAIILSRRAFEGLEMPRSRQALIELLRAHPERFEGRIGTYDVRLSGLGYLFATQDARTSETFWRLSEVMGALGVRLYCCSGRMIAEVASGELALAYNVLGSYARAAAGEDLEIVLPEDFVTVMQRTAFIAAASQEPDLAGAFVDYLVAGASRRAAGGGAVFDAGWLTDQQTALRRIRLGPGLMVFLDRLKKKAFLDAWTSAMRQG